MKEFTTSIIYMNFFFHYKYSYIYYFDAYKNLTGLHNNCSNMCNNHHWLSIRHSSTRMYVMYTARPVR